MKRLITTTLAVLLVSAVAFADHGHGGPGGPGGFGDFGAAGGLVVGSDGTVYITHTTVDTSTNTRTTTLTAIASTGTQKWSVTLTNADRFILSGSNLLTVNETRATDGTITSTLTAISTATGATAWTKTVNGAIEDLTPFSGGTYALIVVPATTTGGTSTRSLVAFDNNGNQLWSVAV